jgi:hypothetical protein
MQVSCLERFAYAPKLCIQMVPKVGMAFLFWCKSSPKLVLTSQNFEFMPIDDGWHKPCKDQRA